MGLDYQYSFKILKIDNELGEEGVKNLNKKSTVTSERKRTFIEGRTISKIKRRTERTSCGWRNLDRTEGSQMDRERKRGEKKFGIKEGWDYLKKSRYSCQKPSQNIKRETQFEPEKFPAKFTSKSPRIKR
ncbi:MAG UNVERIFIED_CONTAM: hypothetical protein LVR29_04025 [Microcystis novacekii LVE1205-3]